MPQVSNFQPSFIGGIWSPSAQGRADDPRYTTAMNECLNGMPTAEGKWQRRPPFSSAAFTRAGAPARLEPLSLTSIPSHNMEFTDGHLRFFESARLLTDGDRKRVYSISTATPAVITLDPHEWETGDHVVFAIDIVLPPDSLDDIALLANRVFRITSLSGDTFSIRDSITGVDFDGDSIELGAATTVSVARVTDFPTPYEDGSWSKVRSVQTDKSAVFLSPGHWPQVLDISRPAIFPTFRLDEADFTDGPYYDPPIGVEAVSNALKGIIPLHFQYAEWDSTVAYDIGHYARVDANVYKSLITANVNQDPTTNADKWVPVGAFDFVNNAQGFGPGDVGRHIRLYSEPPLWDESVAYVKGNNVTYRGAQWTAQTSSTGSPPGSTTDGWIVNANAARWTWGKIVEVGGGDDEPEPLTGTELGNLSPNANLIDADPETTAEFQSIVSAWGGLTLTDVSLIDHATIGGIPRAAEGLIPAGWKFTDPVKSNVTLELWAKEGTAPSSETNGTRIATTGLLSWDEIPESITVFSSVRNVEYKHIWWRIIVNIINPEGTEHVEEEDIDIVVADFAFYSETFVDQDISVQILGDPLLYTDPVRRFRLGRYNNTEKNYPTCGCYHQGRLWLGSNRGFDASIPGLPLVFSPTETDGTVTDGSALRYDFDTQSKNDIIWMQPDDEGSILMGTGAGEWYVSASTGRIITPVNIDAYLKTGFGSSDAGAVLAGMTVVFAHKDQRSLHECFFDAYTNKLVSPSLSERAPHLTKTGIKRVCYTGGLSPYVWAVTNDDRLLGVLYKRDNYLSQEPPAMSGWHRHQHGRSSRVITDVCPAKSLNGTADTIAVVTKDKETGFHRVEVMADPMEDTDDIYSVNYLDGFYSPTNGTFFGTAVQLVETPASPGHWRMPGWTLTKQCSPYFPVETAREPYAGIAPHTLVGADWGVTDGIPFPKPDTIYLSAPTGLVFSDCGTVRFTSNGEVPGVNSFLLGESAPIASIGQWMGVLGFAFEQFQDDSYTLWQQWTRNPGTVGAAPMPTWNPAVEGSTEIITLGTPEGLSLAGLADIDGQTVRVFAAGLDLGKHHVIDGKLQISFGEVPEFTLKYVQQVSQLRRDWGIYGVDFDGKYNIPIVIGFDYTSRGQRLRPIAPAEAGTAAGPGFAKERRNHAAGFLFHNTKGVQIGTDFDHLTDTQLRTKGEEDLGLLDLFSGIHYDTVDDDYSFEGAVCWQSSGVWPVNVCAVSGFLMTQDK